MKYVLIGEADACGRSPEVAMMEASLVEELLVIVASLAVAGKQKIVACRRAAGDGR